MRTTLAALDGFSAETTDLLLLDVGLPDADGRDICQALRARGVQTPVLFLTARDALTDRVTGFSAGGDDYVAKPFAFAELVARIRALLRRAAPQVTAQARAPPLPPVNPAAFPGATHVPFTPPQLRLLAKLAPHPRQS